MRVDRMLTIIVMLLNRPRVSAKELADQFEVSVRTVYRDIEAINLAGIPVISYQGNNGGFGIVDNYKLSHQLLTFDNLTSLLTALKGVNASLGDTQLDASIEKLHNLIPSDKSEDLSRQLEELIIEKQPWVNNKRHKEQIQRLRQAIAGHKLITIRYQNYESDISDRQIEPMSLIFKGYAWYLFAYCRLKEDYRLFRVSRLLDVTIDHKSFERRERSYEDVYGEASKDQEEIQITLKFRACAKTRVVDIFEKDQIQELATGDLIVKASFPQPDWYYAFILSFGVDVEVIQPKIVRDEVKRRIGEMMATYQ